MKCAAVVLFVLISFTAFAQGAIPITADTAADLVNIGIWGPGRALDVAFSPDGKLLAVGTTKGVQLFEVGAFGEGDMLDPNGGFSAGSVSFHPTSDVLLSSGIGYNVRAYDTTTGELLVDSYPDDVSGALGPSVVAPDGVTAAITAGDVLNVVDWETSTVRFQSTGHISLITSVAYSADSSRIATGSADTTINVWDVATGENITTLSGHTERITGVAFTPDGSQVLSASLDGTLRLWDVATSAQVALIYEEAIPLKAMALTADGTTAAISDDIGRVALVDMSSQGISAGLSEEGTPMISLAFSADGSLLAGVREGQLQLWDVGALSELGSAEYEARFLTLAVSADGSQVAAGGFDGATYLLDAATGDILNTYFAGLPPVTGLAFTIESPTLYIGSADSNIREIDIVSGDEVGFLEGTAAITDMTSHPTISMINAAMADGQLRWWSTETGEVFGTAPWSEAALSATAFSPDGRWMASADVNGGINIWDVASGDFLYALDGANASVRDVAFSHDGERLVAGLEDGRVAVWAIGASSPPVMDIGGIFTGAVVAVEFSPDGSLIVGGSLDGTMRTLNASTGEQIEMYYDHDGQVYDVAFSPDGTRLYSAGEDGLVVAWGIFQ